MYSTNKNITQRIETLYSEVVSWRRHLHRNPELSFHEYETTRWITEKLEHLGYEVHRPCETGCVAVLQGKNNSDRVVALRADIDALPIREEGGAKKEFLSNKEEVAHCCGHDAHTAILLGTAVLLSEFREHIDGTAVLIFQAGEEMLPGGGRLLVETGILQQLGVQQIFGLHTSPFHKSGDIAVKDGAIMASTQEFTVEVTGRGGHAAMPHIAVDPIVISAQIIQQIQTIVSRRIDPTDAAVVTVGKLHGGTARNIIPEKVTLEGTIRTFDESQAEKIFEYITGISEQVAAAAGGHAEAERIPGYPPVINHPETTQLLIETAGEDTVGMERPFMAGEDFSFYMKDIPGTFFFLGSGSDEADSRYPWHHPRYNVDEMSLKTGIRIMASLALSDT